MTWTAPEVALPEFPVNADERPLLEGFRAWHRALLQHKCAGLTGEQLAQRSVEPSNLSLLGLIRHLAKVERKWFVERIGGQDLESMYDPELGDDADFEALAAASYNDEIESRDGPMSVRAVVIHMIEEYAQHNGHADLLRERVDGVTDK